MTDFASRYVTLADPLDAYDRVAGAVDRVLAATSPDRLQDPTPCGDWLVLDVMNHLVETVDTYGALAAHGVQPVEGEVRRYADPAALFPPTAATCRTAFAAPGFLDAVGPTPIGPQPGRVVVQHVVNELTTHGWDLARGTGQDTDLVPDVAEAVLASWRAFFAEWDRAALAFNFSPARPAPASASPADRLAAYMGRVI